MSARILVLPVALASVLAIGACDRRDAYPPDESRTTTDQVAPPGVDGGLVDADDRQPTDDRCEGLSGDALSECTHRAQDVPMILGNKDNPQDASARDNRTSDESDGLETGSDQ